MADLSDKDAAQTVKLVGVGITGTETNYIDATVNGLKVDGSAVTQPISASSLPLPTGAATAALQTQPGVDIGDVTINNTSGAGAVNIQDGGNSITVDGTVAATQSGTWTVQPGNTANTTPWLSTINQGGLSATVTNSPAVLTSSGLVVRPIPYEPQSYSASAAAFTVATNATDIFLISGSASKTIRIHKIDVTGTTTSGSAIKITINLIKRSTANTGGTSVISTIVPHDSNNSAATAVARHYTANPTLGTSVGIVRSVSTSFQGAGLTDTALTWDFSDDGGQPIILRGTSENLAVNFNATSVVGSVISVSCEWSEV